MTRNMMWVWLAAGALALGGCAAKKPAQQPDAGTSQGAAVGAGTEGAGGEGVTSAPLGDDTATAGPQGELLGKRIIYFDFDRAELKPADEALISAHAAYLASHPATRVRLEGHTDERGTREYNIGLGERRAQTVRRALLLQGVAETQVATVSYGEERPAAAGSDEVAWAQNRRVEIVYLN
ncbi:MAG: Peptidoglycan-associated lipoprotein [Steroidobacteraceae bacterium]|nr:Peptidoglycan-associated lipoprotein [Steroidobacteraceae bacterium]